MPQQQGEEKPTRVGSSGQHGEWKLTTEVSAAGGLVQVGKCTGRYSLALGPGPISTKNSTRLTTPGLVSAKESTTEAIDVPHYRA